MDSAELVSVRQELSRETKARRKAEEELGKFMMQNQVLQANISCHIVHPPNHFRTSPNRESYDPKSPVQGSNLAPPTRSTPSLSLTAQANVGRLQCQVGRLSNELEALRRRCAAPAASAAPQGIFAAHAAPAVPVAAGAAGARPRGGGEAGEPAPWYVLVDRVQVAGARVVDFAPDMVSAVVSCASGDGDHALTLINLVTRWPPSVAPAGQPPCSVSTTHCTPDSAIRSRYR